jgi:hypothetical protein
MNLEILILKRKEGYIMTEIIMINPNVALYAIAYKATKEMHKTVQLTDALADVINNYINTHPECVTTLDELEKFIEESEEEDE